MSTSIAATTLALGLVLGNSAQAASPSAKPAIAGAKKHSATKGKEGTATHEMSEASAGTCLLYTSPSPRDRTRSRMPSSA